jgi:hypothetical protein
MFGLGPDLYGASLSLTFVARLRQERRFAGPEDLVRQIGQDIEQARSLLGSLMEDTKPLRDPLRDAQRDPLRDAKRDPLRDAKRDDD